MKQFPVKEMFAALMSTSGVSLWFSSVNLVLYFHDIELAMEWLINVRTFRIPHLYSSRYDHEYHHVIVMFFS